MLVIGARLTPDPAGHGTHTGLGLPPCGWLMAFGKPCVTCGMTTAVSHMAHGHVGRSFATQPFGALVAILAAMFFWFALHTAITGSRAMQAALDLLRPRVLWTLAALAAAAWAYTWATWPSPERGTSRDQTAKIARTDFA